MRGYVTNRKLTSRAKQLAALTAAGASAIALTGGKAKADTIISNILNVTVGFSSDYSPPTGGRETVNSHIFNSLAGGPSFAFRAVSSNQNRQSNRFNRYSSSNQFFRSIQADNVGFAQTTFGGVARFAAGAVLTNGMAIGSGANVGERAWSSMRRFSRFSWSSNGSFHTSTRRSTHSNNDGTCCIPSFTDKYLLFRFQHQATTEYGWIEASMSVTSARGSLASYGPNLTIIQYGFDNSGAVIAAGAGTAPEPSTLAESGVAALILGAEGLRRWRKARERV
jgi:hypothetical protein